MQIQHLHDWNIAVDEAIALQKRLAQQVIYDRPLNLDSVKLVAGVDVSVKTLEGERADGNLLNTISQAAVVVLSFPELKIIETVLAKRPTPFPYVPGLLSFREGPVLEEAFAKLEHEPDRHRHTHGLVAAKTDDWLWQDAAGGGLCRAGTDTRRAQSVGASR
jgi:deoxyribonuclease V